MTKSKHFRAAGFAAGALAAASTAAVAQSGESDIPRTPWGAPDIAGVYSEYTTAPIERPEEFGDREFLTDEEFAVVERARLGEAEYVGPELTNDVHYDMDAYGLSANEGVSSPNRRTSIVISPENGRIPPLVPEAVARAEALAEERRGHEFDGPEMRSLNERCMGSSPPPLMAYGYNSNLQIFQSPGYVVIQAEMGDPRIVPTDGRAMPEDPLPTWAGTSVGRWDGDTLVVETTGFRPEIAWRGSTGDMLVTERITRIDEDTLEYAFTVEDPATWAEPWSGVYPLTEMDTVLFEYACTEGNYGIANTLSGVRAEEAAVAESE